MGYSVARRGYTARRMGRNSESYGHLQMTRGQSWRTTTGNPTPEASGSPVILAQKETFHSFEIDQLTRLEYR